ncbi:MAG: shikimate kinase, partial [Eggerthellaceae bacterium]
MASRQNAYSLEKPVYLIGFMGAGKSSVGRYLSRKYGFTLVDADSYLEEREGMKISQIFEEHGEEHFRDLETRYLVELSMAPQIISTGGGVVKRPENRAFMKEHGFVIYLSVTAEAAAARIRD